MGQPGGPVGGPQDLLDVRPDGVPCLTRALPLRLLGHKSRVAGDNPQQVVEVVRHATGQLAQALQPLRLLQLALHPVPLGLGAVPLPLGLDGLPLADVPDGRRDQDALPGIDGRQGDLGRERAAIPAAPGQFQARSHRPGPGVGDIVGPVVRVHAPHQVGDQDLHRLPDQFLPVIPEQPLGLRVDQGDPAVILDADHRVRCRFQQPQESAVGKVPHTAHSRVSGIEGIAHRTPILHVTYSKT